MCISHVGLRSKCCNLCLAMKTTAVSAAVQDGAHGANFGSSRLDFISSVHGQWESGRCALCMSHVGENDMAGEGSGWRPTLAGI